MKRGLVLVSLIFLILSTSVFVSAGSFSNLFDKITGKPTSETSTTNIYQVCSLPEILEQTTCSFQGIGYIIQRTSDSTFEFSYSGVTEEFSIEVLQQVTLQNGIIVKRYVGSDGEFLKLISSTSHETSTTNTTLASSGCSLQELEVKICSYLDRNYTVERNVNSTFIISYEGVSEEFSLQELTQVTLKDGVTLKRGIGSTTANLIFFKKEIHEEGCILQELESKECSYLGTVYTVKRETQCQFGISYNGITETFELSSLEQRTLKNGVYVKNPNSCSSVNLNLIFGGEEVSISNQCPLQQLISRKCSYLNTVYTVKRKTQCQLEVSYNGITETFELPMLTQKTLKNGVYLKNSNPCDSVTLNLVFGGKETNQEECILQQLTLRKCSYLSTIYTIKRETQCQFGISYNGITETFELPMLTQKTLKNGVYLKNSNPCESIDLKLIFSGEEKPSILPGEDEPQDVLNEDYFCQGCELDSKCYPLGYRKSGKYCSDEESFVQQLKAESSCDNNFECEGNLCINSECISQNFLQKILDFFKKLFGGTE